MKKVLLFLFAFLSVCGVKAIDVKVADHDVLQTTYGTITSNVFTSSEASGVAGVTITSSTAAIGTTALNFATNFGYKSCFSVTTPNTGVHTVTITAPTGYLITGYSMYMKANSSTAPHTVTPAEGGSAVANVGPGGSTIGTQLVVTDIAKSSTSFTVQTANNGNALYFTYFTVTLADMSSTVEVTYVLTEGGEEVDRVVKAQDANSAVEFPSSWDTSVYDYNTSDVIGSTDCTVNVERTVKAKYNETGLVRQASVVAGETYAIFNTTMNGTQNRYGFYYAANSSKLSSQQTRPLSFEANTDRLNDDAYWWVAEDAGDGKFYFKNKSFGTYINGGSNTNLRALVSSSSAARAWTVQPWMTSTETKPNVNSLNHDGTICANANITAANRVFTVSDESASGNARCWNGNDGGGDGAIALWASAHPFAFYQVQEVTYVFNTYVFKESNGTTIEKTVVKQIANDALSIPSAWTTNTDYEYSVTGETGDDNATITVTRTFKTGIVTSLTDLSNSKAYTLTTPRGALGVGDNVLKSTRVGVAAGNFSVVSYEDNLYLYSLDDDAFIVAGGAESQDPTAALTLTQMTYGGSNNRFLGLLGGNGINVNDSDNGVVVNSWTTADDGNVYTVRAVDDLTSEKVTEIFQKLEDYFHPTYTVTYRVVDGNGAELWVSDPQPATLGQTITEMPSSVHTKVYTTFTPGEALTVGTDNEQNVFTSTAVFNLPFETFTTYSSARWYKATIRTSKYVRVQDSEPYYPASDYQNANEYKWAFEGNPYTGIAIYNKAAGESKTLGLGSATISNEEKPTAVMRDGVTRWEVLPNSDGFVLLLPGYENYYVNQNGGASGYLGFWISTNGRTDDGSTWRVTNVGTDAENLAPELEAAIATLSAMSFGSDYGQYGFVGDLAIYKNMEGTLVPQVISAGQTALEGGDFDTMTEQLANLQNFIANIALNVPANGSAFRIKSVHNTYVTNVHGTKGTSQRNTLTADATDPNTIMFYVNNKLYCYGTADQVMGSGSSFYTNIDNFTFRESTIEAGKYAVEYTGNGNNEIKETKVLYAWGPSSSYPNIVDHQGSEAANTVFTLEAVTEIPVEVSEALHATLFLPVGVQAVDGMTLNGVTSKGNDYLTLESVAKVAANTPVVVKADVAGTYDLPVVTDGVTVEGNLLTGVAVGGETIDAEVNAYILGKDEQGVGFFPLSATDRALKSWKAYYVPAGETSARAFYFGEGGVTGINNLLNTTEGAIYDLSGRRVEKAQKGLYIVNGKKVLVK
jgi:hypothetical protein